MRTFEHLMLSQSSLKLSAFVKFLLLFAVLISWFPLVLEAADASSLCRAFGRGRLELCGRPGTGSPGWGGSRVAGPVPAHALFRGRRLRVGGATGEVLQ